VAVLAVVAQDGFEGATIRRVAARAGCSAGAVQKRFPTRSGLLRAAFEHVVASVSERMTAEVNQPGARGDTLIMQQRRGALHTLPLDFARRSESLVWTSYLLRAAVDESLRDLPRHLDRAVRDTLADDLHALHPARRPSRAVGRLGRRPHSASAHLTHSRAARPSPLCQASWARRSAIGDR
jgi:TetR/AcrR family transcriptional repressor of bet genes